MSVVSRLAYQRFSVNTVKLQAPCSGSVVMFSEALEAALGGLLLKLTSPRPVCGLEPPERSP